MSGLKGLFDVIRPARLVQPGDSYKVSVRILRRHPPPKHHPTPTHHREQIAIPRRLRGVGGQGAVWAVVMDELFNRRARSSPAACYLELLQRPREQILDQGPIP